MQLRITKNEQNTLVSYPLARNSAEWVRQSNQDACPGLGKVDCLLTEIVRRTDRLAEGKN
jgi:hypothetical protein